MFEGQKELRIQEHPGWTLKELLDHLVATHLKERPELFLKDKTMYSNYLLVKGDMTDGLEFWS